MKILFLLVALSANVFAVDANNGKEYKVRGLSTSGNGSITGTLDVGGTSTFQSSVTVNSNLGVSGIATISGTALITGAGGLTVQDSTIATNGPISANYLDLTGLKTDTQLYSFISEMDRPLTSGIEVSNILGRIRWKDSGNSNAILNGIEGVCSSTTTDESITCRGGSFRTYTATGGTIRTSVGADISARAGIPSATDIVAESGTGFIGARIYMAPGFSPGTIANVNNFHGLWIYNEHATNAVTNGIYLSDAGGGFTKDITLQHGESVDNATDGVVTVTAPSTVLSGTLQSTGLTSTGQATVIGTMTVSGAGGLLVDGGYFSVGKSTTLVVENAKVGIGRATYTTGYNPYSLVIKSTTTAVVEPILRLINGVSGSDNNGPCIEFAASDTAGYGPLICGIRRTSGTGDVQIKTGGNAQTAKLTILDNGNVGIGITNPLRTLAVGGMIQSCTAASCASTDGGYFNDDGTNLNIINQRVGNVQLGTRNTFTQGITFTTLGAGANNATISIFGQLSPVQLTAASINTTTPGAAGSLAVCTNCSTVYSLCVSSGTAQGAWVLMNTANHCQ